MYSGPFQDHLLELCMGVIISNKGDEELLKECTRDVSSHQVFTL